MSKVKLMLVAVFAALALSAVAAGTASAQWLVEGGPLGGGKSAAIASLANLDGGAATLTAINGTIKIACTGPIHITNGRILEPDLGYADAIVFLNCGTVAPTPTICRLLNNGTEPIETVAVLALAALGPTAPEGRLTFKPESGKRFTSIHFTDEETGCVFQGAQPISGSVTAKVPTGRTENVEQGLEGLGSVENNSLEIGSGNKAFLGGGKLLLLLASHSKWSFD